MPRTCRISKGMKCVMGVAIQARTNAKNQQAREHLVKPGALRVPLHLLPAIVPNAFDHVSTNVQHTHLGTW